MFPDFTKIQDDINDFIESTNKTLLEIIDKLDSIETQLAEVKNGQSK